MKSGFPKLGEYTSRFAETGLIGVVLFLIPPIYLLWELFNSVRRKSKVEADSTQEIFFMISLMGILASGIGDSLNITYAYWIMLGLGYTILRKIERNSMNQRKFGIFLSYLNIMLHAFIGFLYVPILLHYIGKSEYGLYQLMGSLIAYFSIMDFGLTAAVIRFYTKYKALNNQKGMENILALSLRGYGIVTILVLGIGVFCYSFLDQAFAVSMTASELAEAKYIFCCSS